MTDRRRLQRLCGKSLLILAALPSWALAGPPFRTDDPAVVEYRHFEFIAFYQQSLAAGSRSGVMPGFEFHYGAFDNVELDLVTPFAFNTPSAASTERGYGDTELGVKYRFIQETEFNAGGYYILDDRNQVLFSIGKGLQNATQTNRVSSYVGYQLSY